MALMPVVKISDTVDWSVSGTGFWWMGLGVPSISPLRSMGLPKTLMTLPRSPLPTGTSSGRPVSSTSEPRARPWVGVSAMPLIVFSLRWVFTSMMMSLSSPARSTWKMPGRRPVKRASITLPLMESMVPVLSCSPMKVEASFTYQPHH
ncbi:MAG: hypothetical protein BWX71_01999 [Deltaproteobacteria bacterium ADurb.Bin072]|nr:MAG: hypothetical protein BWX71_01999 [Deltaproteobacteria bacterium ADurb.Bin072]